MIYWTFHKDHQFAIIVLINKRKRGLKVSSSIYDLESKIDSDDRDFQFTYLPTPTYYLLPIDTNTNSYNYKVIYT